MVGAVLSFWIKKSGSITGGCTPPLPPPLLPPPVSGLTPKSGAGAIMSVPSPPPQPANAKAPVKVVS